LKLFENSHDEPEDEALAKPKEQPPNNPARSPARRHHIRCTKTRRRLKTFA